MYYYLLIEFLQSLDEHNIGVSKLCCLVCWELLIRLRAEAGTTFQVRGHHATLFYLHLPSWLPTDNVHALVLKFTYYLCCELNTLMNPPQSQHSRTPSLESIGGLSIASNISGHIAVQDSGMVPHLSDFLDG